MYRFLFKSDRRYSYYLIVTVILIPLLVGGGFTLWDRVANYQGKHYAKYGYQLDVPSGWKTMEAENYTWFKAKARTGKRGATLFLGRKEQKVSEMSDKERSEFARKAKDLPKDALPKKSQHQALNCEIWTYEFSKPHVDYGETETYQLLARRTVIWHKDGPISLRLSCDEATVKDFEADWKTMMESIRPAP